MKYSMIVCLFISFLASSGSSAEAQRGASLQIQLKQPVPAIYGGLFAHDLDMDGAQDFVVTSEGHIGAYDSSGMLLWMLKTDICLFPFTHHPSAIAGDMDGDGEQEVAFLIPGMIRIVNGLTGKEKRSIAVKGKVVAMSIANLQGKGDQEGVLQYTQTHIKAISLCDGRTLWETDAYRGIEHSPLRMSDLDGDGLDEVAGATLIDHDGTRMNTWDLGDTYQSMDSMVIADIVPGLPLEVALAEQRGAHSHTVVVNPDKIVFRTLNPWNWEDPDKLAVGDFDSARPGLEVYNRSSGGDGTAPRGREEPFQNEEAPWVIDAGGRVIAKYYVNDHKPQWWTGHGIEEICRIDWDGDDTDEIAGKERHKEGACAILNPITGEFKEIFQVRALRLYVADVLGDWREEVVILDKDGYIRVYENKSPPRGRPRDRYWRLQHYRRQKQNWDYYSP